MDEYQLIAERNKMLDLFFAKEDQVLIAKLRELEAVKKTREELAKVSGIQNQEILDHLVKLGIGASELVALELVPLVAVAWADGTIDAKEQQAVSASADKMGIKPDGIESELLKQWLTHCPKPAMLEAWKKYMHGVAELLTPEERKNMKDELLAHARSVAEASGGFLGLGNKVSKAEQAVLDDLAGAFV